MVKILILFIILITSSIAMEDGDYVVIRSNNSWFQPGFRETLKNGIIEEDMDMFDDEKISQYYYKLKTNDQGIKTLTMSRVNYGGRIHWGKVTLQITIMPIELGYRFIFNDNTQVDFVDIRYYIL